MRLPDPSPRRGSLALPLAGAALFALAALTASCVEAIDAGGYTDALADMCTLVDRCYGGSFEDCDANVSEVVGSFDEPERAAWLSLAATSKCLESCNGMRRCLDVPPICKNIGLSNGCTSDEACCGFSQGTSVCREGACCNTLGAACNGNGDCCPNTGFCDKVTHTCGGVICVPSDVACVNDFQCCTGRCDDDTNLCTKVSCSPDAFECATNEECCSQYCDPAAKKCRVAPCGVAGTSCKEASDCCSDVPFCYDGDGVPGGSGGVCSAKVDCSPNNSDCANSDQCCSGYCIPEPYHLCGNCVGTDGACSVAAPCCDGLVCNDDFACVTPPG